MLGGRSESKRHPSLSVIPDETHRALVCLPLRMVNEAEIRAILKYAVRPESRVKLGTLLADIGREAGGIELDIERERAPAYPMSFE